MKRILPTLTGALLLSTVSGFAAAATLFSDNFDSEMPGFNVAPSNWTVSNGTVDIIGSGAGGTSFNFLPGNGYFIDLDGSTSDAARMTLATPLSLITGVAYNLSFSLAGSQRWDSDSNTVVFGIDFDSDDILDVFQSTSLPSAQGFTAFTLLFTPGASTSNARIIFDHSGGDTVGLLLDNVALSTQRVITPSVVPEPGSLVLLGIGLVGFGMTRRRKQA